MAARDTRSDPVHKSKATVCTACRQSKVRCGGVGTDPCERCTKLGLDCFRDVNYRRVSKSRKIADLEKQVRQLSSVVNGEAARSTCTSPPQQASSQFPLLSTPSDLGAVNNGLLNQNPLLLDNGAQAFGLQFRDQNRPILNTYGDSHSPGGPDGFATSEQGQTRPSATMAQVIETVYLAPAQIDKLFQIFFHHYHPFLPLLDPSKSADEYHKLSPLLFWAIVSTASRRYRDDVTLLTILSTYVSKNIWAAVQKPPYSLASVQAMLLLCTWSFPTDSTWSEPAVTLSSIAINIAMQVGLHRPVNAQDFLRTKVTINEAELHVRTRTWAAANIVSQELGALAGQLPTAPFDWTVNQACRHAATYKLPENMKILLTLSRYCDRAAKLICMSSIDSMSFSSPSERVACEDSWERDMVTLEQELGTLDCELGGQPSGINLLYYSATRLYLHSFYFFISSESESRQNSILKAYKSASTFVSLLTEGNDKDNLLPYLSTYLVRTLITAACIMLKVLTSSYAASLEDLEAERRLFNESIIVVSQTSILNNDVSAKAVKLLAQSWHSGSTNRRQSPPELIIKSRLGASLVYDFIWTWRQEFGGVPQAYPAPRAPTGESFPEASETFQDAVLANLEFLDDPGWNLVIEGAGMV